MVLSLCTHILTLSAMSEILEPFPRAMGTIVMLVDGLPLAIVATGMGKDIGNNTG